MILSHLRYTSDGLCGSNSVVFFKSLRYNNRARQPLKNRIFLLLPDITSLFLIHMNIHGFSVILETHRSCELFKLINNSNHFSQWKEQTIYPIVFTCVNVYRNPTSDDMGCFSFSTCRRCSCNPWSDFVGNYSLSSLLSIWSAETF